MAPPPEKSRPRPTKKARRQRRPRPTWQQEIAEVLQAHGRDPARPKGGRHRILSYQTQQLRGEILFRCWRILGKLGAQPLTVKNLGEHHVQRLVTYWEDRKLSAGTIQDYLSALRFFAERIGKPGLVRPAAVYLRYPATGVRHYSAAEDKSWSAHGVDADELIDEIAAYDPFIGLQLFAIQAFSLRRREGIFFRPWHADQGYCLLVEDGTKGSRPRLVSIDDRKRKVLDALKQAVADDRDAYLGNPALSAEQAVSRFAYVMQRFGLTKKKRGVTAHGLRHEGANDLFQEKASTASPVRGGTGDGADLMQIHLARAAVAEALGHSRVQIANAYLGSFKELLRRLRKNIGVSDTVDSQDVT